MTLRRRWDRAALNMGRYRGHTSYRAWQVTVTTFFFSTLCTGGGCPLTSKREDTLSFLLPSSLSLVLQGAVLVAGGEFVAFVLTGDGASLDLGVRSGTEDKQTDARVHLEAETMTLVQELALEGQEVRQNP